MRFMRFNVVH